MIATDGTALFVLTMLARPPAVEPADMDPGRARKVPRRRWLVALSGYRDWQLHDAKAHLSDLVRRARAIRACAIKAGCYPA